MKKITPWFIFLCSFLLIYVGQLFISAQYSSASKVGKFDEQTVKFTKFETLFQKISFTTTNGTKIKLADHKDKVVILNFWASWCQPCLSEFETLKKLVDKYPKRKLLVIGINNDEEEPLKMVKKIEKKLNLNFESVVDTSSVTTSEFLISAIPASIAFYNGKVVHYVNKEFDFLSPDFIEKLDSFIQ